jgi:hypothetical protein
MDDVGGSPDAHRRRGSYAAPPTIRTTGEVPAVTGELHRTELHRTEIVAPGRRPTAADARSRADRVDGRGGSVVDRPPPSAPDWMSGVQVPELLVTRDVDREDLDPPIQDRLALLVQRILGLVLVALLVAVVVLVAVGSITGLGPRLR